MRRLTVVAACAVVFGGGAAASAADLSFKDTPVYTPAPAPVWAGLYVGGHIGGLWTGDRSTSALQQACRTPEGGGDDDEDDEHEYPGGGDDDHGGGKDDDDHGGHDHDCNSHSGEDHNDKKHGKRGKYGKHGGGGGKSNSMRMSVAPKTATTTPAAPICTDFTKTSDVTFEKADDGVALIGGVHVGYNWQRQSALVGVEGDVDFADAFDYLATLRGRLGYVSGDLLLYATAGVAFGALSDNTFTFKTPLKSYSFERGDDNEVGVVVGAGVEYKLRRNLSVGLEGLYYFFGEDSNTYSVTEGDTEYRVSEQSDNDVWTVRARMTYHFGGEDEETGLK